MRTGTTAPAKSGWLVPMLVLMVGSFMAVLDSSIVNAAIPTMQREFGTSSDDIEWVSTAYTLALAVVVPISNWVSDRFGATRVHRIAMLGFAAASALCGLAWSFDVEIAFRIIQAIPGGILPVVTLTLLYQIVPRDKMSSAMGIYGLGVVVAPAIGPTLGGYIVQYLDWRLIFYINVPIGILGAVAAYFLLPKLPPKPTHRFDVWGFVTIGYGLAALLLATSKGQDWGWTSYSVLILLVSALLSLALFAVIENEVEYPLINLGTLKRWPFVNSLLMISVLSVGLFAVEFYLPQFLQNGQGLTPVNAGLLLLPQALVMALMMPIAGRLSDRFGARWPAVIGLTVAAYGTYLMTGINVDMTHQEVIDWTIIRGIGNGLAMMPIMTAGLNSLPAELLGFGSALNNIVQRVSSSIGLAAMGALVTNTQAQLVAGQSALIEQNSALPAIVKMRQQGTSALYGYYQQVQAHALAGAYGAVFLVAAALTAACVLLALRLRKPVVTPAPEPVTAPPVPAGIRADRDALPSTPFRPEIPAELEVDEPRSRHEALV